MGIEVPPSVLDKRPGTLVLITADPEVLLFLREDEWGLMKYPAKCPVELRMGTWDVDQVLLVVLLVRLARSDLTTYEAWINVGDPLGVRTLQCLAPQPKIDLHVVTDRIVRSLRVLNPLRLQASELIHTIRNRNAWTPEQFEAAQLRLSRLHPTPSALWWQCKPTEQTTT